MLFLVFKAGENEYALETARVLRVVPWVKLRSIPNAPAYIAGLSDFRGIPVGVIDFSKLINRTPCRRLMSTRIVITEHTRSDGRQILVGLLVEGLTALVKKDSSDLMENVLNTSEVKYLGKMFRDDERIIQVIKVEEIVQSELENISLNLNI